MDKIEALSIEGLRIQSGMSYEEDPPASNISAQSIGEFSALKGKTLGGSSSIGLDGTGGLQLLDIKDNGGEDVIDDGLMGLSLTLDEWMRFDSGEIGVVDERTCKILAAHRATSLDAFRGRLRRGRKCGLLGNNFTVALMVQLRDPLRNYEAVGTPMLSLIQVERVFVLPQKFKIYIPHVGNNEEPKEEEEMIPGYKICEVHVAGLKMESSGKTKKLWNEQKSSSGSRWLLANGMGKKNNKHPLMKSNKKSAPGDTTLWSISAAGDKWKDLLDPHIRNPNETIRLR